MTPKEFLDLMLSKFSTPFERFAVSADKVKARLDELLAKEIELATTKTQLYDVGHELELLKAENDTCKKNLENTLAILDAAKKQVATLTANQPA